MLRKYKKRCTSFLTHVLRSSQGAEVLKALPNEEIVSCEESRRRRRSCAVHHPPYGQKLSVSTQSKSSCGEGTCSRIRHPTTFQWQHIT